MTQNSIDNSASSLTVDNLLIDGNTISSTDTNGNIVLTPDGTGTISVTLAPIVPTGDRADSLGSATNSWDNLYCDGISFNDGTDVMSTYEKTSFTPTLGYSGGVSVEPTYVTQVGYFWRIGKAIYINIVIVISDKGTGSGNIRLGTGSAIPRNDLDTVWTMWSSSAANTALTTGTQFQALMRTNDADIRFYECGSGIFQFLQFPEITDTTEIRVSGMYRAKV